MTTELDRVRILNEVVAVLGPARAVEASMPAHAPEPPKWGFDGVDFTHGKFRARIRYCDALNSQDVRVTLYRGDNPEDAGYAYQVAHVAIWGSASRYASDGLIEKIAAARK